MKPSTSCPRPTRSNEYSHRAKVQLPSTVYPCRLTVPVPVPISILFTATLPGSALPRKWSSGSVGSAYLGRTNTWKCPIECVRPISTVHLSVVTMVGPFLLAIYISINPSPRHTGRYNNIKHPHVLCRNMICVSGGSYVNVCSFHFHDHVVACTSGQAPVHPPRALAHSQNNERGISFYIAIPNQSRFI